MHAQDDCELAAVMQIMLDEVPDDELARKAVLSWNRRRKGILQIGDGPALKRRLNDLPGGFQATDQLGRASRWRGAIPSRLGIPSVPTGEGFELWAAFVQIKVQPSGTSGYHVLRLLAE